MVTIAPAIISGLNHSTRTVAPHITMLAIGAWDGGKDGIIKKRVGR